MTPTPSTDRQGAYPKEDWQLDFTPMCGGLNPKYTLVLVDTFIITFPWKTAKTTEAISVLLSKITPQIVLPESLQSDNGPTFKQK